MREFFDTSVLVASFWAGHPQHHASIRRLAAAQKNHSACGVHTLAEVYAVMTALPVKPLIPPEQAVLFIEEIRERLTVIALLAEEYPAVIRQVAAAGFSGGRVYDALLLACAAKCKASIIYTWNLKHYQELVPDLVSRIQTP